MYKMFYGNGEGKRKVVIKCLNALWNRAESVPLHVTSGLKKIMHSWNQDGTITAGNVDEQIIAMSKLLTKGQIAFESQKDIFVSGYGSLSRS